MHTSYFLERNLRRISRLSESKTNCHIRKFCISRESTLTSLINDWLHSSTNYNKNPILFRFAFWHVIKSKKMLSTIATCKHQKYKSLDVEYNFFAFLCVQINDLVHSVRNVRVNSCESASLTR